MSPRDVYREDLFRSENRVATSEKVSKPIFLRHRWKISQVARNFSSSPLGGELLQLLRGILSSALSRTMAAVIYFPASLRGKQRARRALKSLRSIIIPGLYFPRRNERKERESGVISPGRLGKELQGQTRAWYYESSISKRGEGGWDILIKDGRVMLRRR